MAASRTVPICEQSSINLNDRSSSSVTVASPGSQYNVNTLNNAPNLLSLGVGFSSFDPQKGLKLEVAFDPRNNLTNGHGEPTSLSALHHSIDVFVLTCTVCLSYQTKDAQFKAGEEMGVESVVVPFVSLSTLCSFNFVHL